MNKKVLSAILFSALFAGTGTFTSCIDNDEPAGIEELRGAKAALLLAKVEVEKANAEYRSAEAALKNAEAETEAANTRLQEAMAEAQELANDLLAAKNEEVKAEIQARLVVAQQKAELEALNHQKSMLVAQEALAKAQRSYEMTMKQIEIAKALMSEEQLVKLSDLVYDVNKLNGQIAGKEDAIEDKLAELHEATVYLGADSSYYIGKAEQKLKVAQTELEENAKLIKKYNQYLDLDATLATSEWREEIAKIEAEMADYAKKIAVFDLEKAQKLTSDAYKALEDTVRMTTATFDAKEDSLSNEFKLDENVADTLLYTTVTPIYKKTEDGYILALSKGEGKRVVVKALAGQNYMKENADWTVTLAEEYSGIIASLKAEAASYTKETKYWLDSIADMGETAKAEAKAKAAEALKLYTDALAAYNAATPAASLNKLAADATAAKTKFDTDFATAGTDAAKKKTAAEAYRKALSAWYTAAAKNGMTFNKFALPTYSATGAVSGASKGVNEWLNDATNGADYLLMMIEGKDNLFTKVSSQYFILNNTTAETAKVTIGESKDLATSVNAAIVNLAQDLLKPLQDASEIAFGKLDNYVNCGLPAGASQNGYLHNQPDSVDFVAVYKANGPGVKITKNVGTGTAAKTYEYYANMGIYGYSKLALSDDTHFVAENYEAIIADINAAVAKWSALVDEIVAEYEAEAAEIKVANEAKVAAEKAAKAFSDKVDDEYKDATKELEIAKDYAEKLYGALVNAVDTYLTEEYKNEAGFVKAIEELLNDCEAKVLDLEWAVARAQANVDLTKEGNYSPALLVEQLNEELVELQEELAELLKQLTEATEKLATAEEIWNAAE